MRIRTILLAVLLVTLTQCGPQKRLLSPSPDLPENLPERYRYALNRNASAENLTIQNVRIKFQTPDNSTRLSAGLKLKPDSAILLSLRAPLGIEVSRILYTRDSVTVVDRRNKSVHYGDYQNIAGLLPFDFDYEVLKAIFLGNIPAGYQVRDLPEPGDMRDTLNNETYLGTFRAHGSSDGMDFYGWIYQDIIKPSFLVFHRENSTHKLKIHFQSYAQKADQWFPEEVEIRSNKQQYNSTISLEMGVYEVNQTVHLDLQIPSSYKTIRY